MLAACLTGSLFDREMEAIFSIEMSVNFSQNKGHIPENSGTEYLEEPSDCVR
jgi:hypothetical protein